MWQFIRYDDSRIAQTTHGETVCIHAMLPFRENEKRKNANIHGQPNERNDFLFFQDDFGV